MFIMTIPFFIAIYGYAPIVTSFANQMNASATLVGLIAGAYGFGQLTARLPLGVWSDNLGRRKIFIVCGCALAFIGPVLTIIVQSPVVLMFSRLLTGIAVASWGHFMLLYSSYFPPEGLTKAVGLISVSCYLGQFLGNFLSGIVADRFGVLATFYFTAMVALIVFFMACFLFEEKRTVDRSNAMTFKKVFSSSMNRDTIIFTIITAIGLYCVFGTAFGFTPLFAEDYFNADKFQLSIITSVTTLAAVPACYLCTKIGPNTNVRMWLTVSFSLCGAAGILIPFSPSMLILYILQTFVGFFGNIIVTIISPLVIRGLPFEKQASSLCFYQAFYSAGIVFGPVLTGVIMDFTRSYILSFALIPIICLISIMMVLIPYKEKSIKPW